MNTNKFAALSILQRLEENRQFSGFYKKLTIPATPAGKEKQIHAIGAKIKPSQYSRFTPAQGKGEVKGFYMENGFAHYEVAWDSHKGKKNLAKITVEREKDVIAA